MRAIQILASLLALAGTAYADQVDLGPYGCASVDDDAACADGVAVSVFGDAASGPAGAYYEPSASASVLGDAHGGNLAAAPAGGASSPGGVAVSALGPTYGWWSLTALGPARGAWAGSVAGDAEGRFLAASVLGGARAEDCALVDAPPATVSCTAVSGVGPARGPIAVSACNIYGPACA